MLTHWRGPKPVDQHDLEYAKQILNSFDVVLIMEWFNDETQITALNSLFSGRNNIATTYKVKGDQNMINLLRDRLSPDEQTVLYDLARINRYDIELYEYALTLAAKRLKLIPIITDDITNNLTNELNHSIHCRRNKFPIELKESIGIFRPPGHKGPF
eukprot:gene18315-24002_t